MKNKKQIHVKDPIDLEIKWQRLVAIMDEIDNATIKIFDGAGPFVIKDWNLMQ